MKQKEIQKEIKDRLVDDLLFGKLKAGGTVLIDVKDDELTFDLKPKGKSGLKGKSSSRKERVLA